VLALIDAAGRQRAIVVGHDWGGAVAWRLAEFFPQRIERAIIINVPHPAVMMDRLRRSPAQLARSSYMFFFQIPWLPERLLTSRRGSMLARSLRRTSRPGTFSADDLERYREAWRQPGAMTGMLNWYRAAIRHLGQKPAKRPIETPTLLIWGARDRFIGREAAQPSIDRCTNGKLVFLEEATHWAPHEEPARVNQLLLEFANRA
jgi:pimeloyl-ACP methyl ester carboxylesterase